MLRVAGCLILITSLSSTVSAQYNDLDPAKWFPLELGNYWSYECCEDVIKDEWVVFSERDTLVDGQRWVFFKEVYGSGPYYGGVVSLWDSTVGDWYTMTDDYYVLRSLRDSHSILPTMPRSVLTSTAARDDSTFSTLAETLSVTIRQGDNGSEEDSTNLLLNAYNGYPPDAGGFGFRFYYKIGLDGSGYMTLTGARVNGIEWGDQSRIDQAIVLGRELEALPGQKLRLDVYPNPARGRPTIRIDAASAGEYLIEVFDVLGRRQFAGREFLAAGAVETRGDLWHADSPSGIYLVSVTTGDGTRAVRQVTVVR